jgi:hypothetical protein
MVQNFASPSCLLIAHSNRLEKDLAIVQRSKLRRHALCDKRFDARIELVQPIKPILVMMAPSS